MIITVIYENGNTTVEGEAEVDRMPKTNAEWYEIAEKIAVEDILDLTAYKPGSVFTFKFYEGDEDTFDISQCLFKFSAKAKFSVTLDIFVDGKGNPIQYEQDCKT